jgi:hypothetical protein
MVHQSNADAIVCQQCGTSLTEQRAPKDNSGFTDAMCIQCLWENTECLRNRIEEMSGLRYGEDGVQPGLGATDAQVDGEWARNSAILKLFTLLQVIDRTAGSGETINTVWTDGPVDEPQTESIVTLNHVRSLLAKYGYEEIRVVTSRTDDPMPEVILPEGRAPHWTTHIEFSLMRDRKE